MCATLPDRRFETQQLLAILVDYVIPHTNAGVRRIFPIGHFHKERKCGCMFRQGLELSSSR